MKTYFALRRSVDKQYQWDPEKGAFKGGPSGTSQAPHLYLSRGKAQAKCYAGWEVVEVRLEVIEIGNVAQKNIEKT